jgi:hypothetical protein
LCCNTIAIESKLFITINLYITSERGNVAKLKDQFCQTLPAEVRRRARTEKQLLDGLEEQGVLGNNNVKLLLPFPMKCDHLQPSLCIAKES